MNNSDFQVDLSQEERSGRAKRGTRLAKTEKSEGRRRGELLLMEFLKP